MIKVNELRIKNLVTLSEKQRQDLCDDQIHAKNEFFEVKTVYSDNDMAIQLDDEIVDFMESDVEPIQLTEEWLHKFGFVFEDIGTNPTEEEKRYRYAEIGFGSKCFGIVFDTETGIFTLQNVVGELVEYQYVHHLQNVYYWNTFRELEIKE